MKYLEFALVNAAPQGNNTNAAFTDRVMKNITATPLHNVITPNQKPSLWYQLRHLPKFAVVILAIAALFIASGVTYAVVETIKQSNVKVDTSGVNEFGRKQLSVTFDSCAEEKKAGTTYELTKDSGLSADDGAKVIQARCDLDFIDSWLQQDQAASGTDKYGQFIAAGSTQGIAGTLAGTADTSITLHTTSAFTKEEHEQTFPLPEGTQIIDGTKEVDRSTLKPGDTILYYSPYPDMPGQSSGAPKTVVIFKLNLPPKYYGLDMRSYVKARGACSNNPARTCLLNNSINTVVLIVSHGGAWINPGDGQKTMKNIQGKVVSWTDSEIKLDAGKGVIYTVTTPSNVVGTYNRTTVYGLKSLDTIYANTDPELLKIKAGDSLEITYQEDMDHSSQTIPWSKTLTIALMVERRVDDLTVLRKY